MEANRRAAGLDGVRFVTRRWAAMEEAARRVQVDGVEARVVLVAPRDGA
jgi:hypothetical protein